MEKDPSQLREQLRAQLEAEEQLDYTDTLVVRCPPFLCFTICQYPLLFFFLTFISILEAEYLKEARTSSKVTAKFTYAVCLLKTPSRSNREKALVLLREIEIANRKANLIELRELYYYLALAYMRLGDYTPAREYCDSLLNMEPNNTQALALRALIQEQVHKDGLLGMALVGGGLAAAAAITLGAFLLAKK
jgi:fission 1 protein